MIITILDDVSLDTATQSEKSVVQRQREAFAEFFLNNQGVQGEDFTEADYAELEN